MASRTNSRLISNSYAHQADRSAAPSNTQHAPRRQQHQQFLHGSMARRAPIPTSSSSSLSLAPHAPTFLARSDSRATTATAASSTSTVTASAATAAAAAAAATDDPESDIIVRDERGDYRLDMPSMTPLPRDEARDEREMENGLIETFRKHHQQIEPAELRRTLQASLAAKAASLDRDAWMFEGDDAEPVEEV